MKNQVYLNQCNGLVFVFFFSFFFNYATAQTKLIGCTPRGGDGFGTIYSIEPGATSFFDQIKVQGISGLNPVSNRLVLGTNGKFYGNATAGGFSGEGVIFEYDAAMDKYTNKIDLTYGNGATPEGSLTPLSPGKFLGHTSFGGLHEAGVIFEYDYTTNTYTDKIDLVPTEGSHPLADLVQASNGKFYGITLLGGANNLGVIYEYDHDANIYTKKIDMTVAGGNQSAYTMVEAPNGKFYGTTYSGGANAFGTIFEYDFVNNIYTDKIDMTLTGGTYPVGSLFLAPNGKFYGITQAGSNAGRGAIFEYDYVTNTYTKKFSLAIAPNGLAAKGPLMLASDGKLYGVTSGGGINGGGALFQYDYVTNAYTKKIDLQSQTGSSCACGLAEAANGKLYATSNLGGYANAGVLFEYDLTNNIYTRKKDFGVAGYGSRPYGSPVKADNGKIYFLTYEGGFNGQGTIIEYDHATNEYTKKVDLSGIDGAFAFGGLTQAGNGKLYGMTNGGGSSDEGALFEYDYVTNILTKKKDFAGLDGTSPYGTMLLAGNGKLYGTTQRGGANGLGVLFEYDYTTGTYTKLIDFTIGLGYIPGKELTEASNGKIYGSTTMGAIGGHGSIFEYDYTTNSFATKLFLNGTNGESISGTFIEADNGKLYGMTSYGGVNNVGVIFEYDYNTNAYTKKIDLSSANGSNPNGSLVQSRNGKLYGVTMSGGTSDQGVLFEYDYVTNTYTKKIDFDYDNGSWPYSDLVEVDLSVVPVTLMDFKATRSGNTALLRWKTSQETNSDHIDIERSPDGGSFSFLSRVKARGNSAAINNYSFNDTKTLPWKNYYRLKLVSADGSIQYSDIRMVMFDKEGEVIVYPNPVQSQFNLSFAGNWVNKNVQLSLYNQSGQELWHKEINRTKQIECIQLNKPANGFYLLKIQQEGIDAVYKKIQVIN